MWRTSQSVISSNKNKKWIQKYKLEYSNLFDFVIKSTKSDEHAFCTVCSADFSIVHGRRNDITQHAGTIKHAHGAGRSIASFFWQ